MTENKSLQYGNWIRWKILLYLGLGALGCGLLGLFPFPLAGRLAAEAASILLFASLLYPLTLYCMFAPWGGNLQEKVFLLIVRKLGERLEGQVLDIGSGNGILALKLAQANPELRVIGLDNWGPDWTYSQSVCHQNAAIAGVQEQVVFIRGNAARLEFAPDTFDAVVSNLTFHEVRSVPNKRELVREALRVLKPGGRFVFVDYFFESRYYGELPDFNAFLADLGLRQVTLKPMHEALNLSGLLKQPKAFGRVGLLVGVK
jgi:SAM-dependent methyltransferase